MSSSNEIQTNPVEISTQPQAEPPAVQPTTPESITNTNNNRNTADEKQQMECRCSGIWHFFCRKRKEGEGSSSTGGPDNSYERRVEKLKKNLREIEQHLGLLDEFRESSSPKELRDHLEKLKEILSVKQEESHTGTKTPDWIPKISKEIMKFKQQISSTDRLKEKLSLSADLQSSTGSKGGSRVLELGIVHQSASFSSSSFYNEIADFFKGLDKREKFFLSCFTVFPENAVVKRRIFVYWGLGEGMLNAPGINGQNAGEALLPPSGTDEEKNTGEASSDASVTEDKKKNTPEKIVDRILEEFQEKGLIEAITKKRKQREHVKSYKMHPLVRSAVIQISKQLEEKDKFFDYDNKGNVLPQRDWASDDNKVVENVLLPHCVRMCLLKAEEHEQYLERKPSEPTKEMPKQTQISDTDLESVVTLFNVNEPFPDLELAWLSKLKDKNSVGKLNKEPSAEDWLSKMKNAQVVCLGSWPGSAKPHIEVESIEFLKGLTSSKYLRFLSLQGISRITELPDSIGKHSNLVILDLKECHNLEMLPGEITKLKELRYLDLSDCYLLARMPEGLGALSKLVVLKGFVIGNPPRKNLGTLNDLTGLKKLRKLTINASSEEFPTEKDLDALRELGKNALRKLTIAWGAEPNKADPKTEVPKNGNAAKQTPAAFAPTPFALTPCLDFLLSSCAPTPSEKNVISPTPKLKKLPEELKKLDLQCFPKSTATWLTPDLSKLEKLYIRGGNLATLEDLDKKTWPEVKTLRLKYLRDMKMTWIKMQESFPKLKYLEKVKCPGITLCPCDEHGVWMTDES